MYIFHPEFPLVGGRAGGGIPPTTHTTQKIGLSHHVPPLLCPKNVVIIFMQFLTILHKIPPPCPPPTKYYEQGGEVSNVKNQELHNTTDRSVVKLTPWPKFDSCNVYLQKVKNSTKFLHAFEKQGSHNK